MSVKFPAKKTLYIMCSNEFNRGHCIQCAIMDGIYNVKCGIQFSVKFGVLSVERGVQPVMQLEL